MVAENQYGTRRLARNPVRELLEAQQQRMEAEQRSALQRRRAFPFQDVVKIGDKYYRYDTDNQGRVVQNQISKQSYENAIKQNAYTNSISRDMGFPTQETTQPPAESEDKGFFARSVDAMKNYLNSRKQESEPKAPSTAKKPVNLDPTRMNQSIQAGNPNLRGSNIDITKSGTTGGAVKTGLMDDKIGQTSPIVDPVTEAAYQRSLSQKGKPPPNVPRSKEAPKPMSAQDYANVQNRRTQQVEQKIKDQVAKAQSMSPTERYEAAMDRRVPRSSNRLPVPGRNKAMDMAVERMMINRQLAQNQFSNPMEVGSSPEMLADMPPNVLKDNLKNLAQLLPKEDKRSVDQIIQASAGRKRKEQKSALRKATSETLRQFGGDLKKAYDSIRKSIQFPSSQPRFDKDGQPTARYYKDRYISNYKSFK